MYAFLHMLSESLRVQPYARDQPKPVPLQLARVGKCASRKTFFLKKMDVFLTQKSLARASALPTLRAGAAARGSGPIPSKAGGRRRGGGGKGTQWR